MIAGERKNRYRKLVTIGLVYAILIMAIIVYFVFIRTPQLKIDGILIEPPQTIADFNLTDNHGKPFTKASLKGHWTLVFFGFTRCPMICPTAMDVLNKAYKILQQDLPPNELPHVIFITVDPDNDSITKLDHFVGSYNSSFIGARGNEKETLALEKELHIKASKSQQGQIDHSMDILLLNPAVQIQAYFPFPHHPQQIAEDYKIILNTKKY